MAAVVIVMTVAINTSTHDRQGRKFMYTVNYNLYAMLAEHCMHYSITKTLLASVVGRIRRGRSSRLTSDLRVL